MDRKKEKYVHIRDIVSLYSNFDMIKKFHQGIGFSSTGRDQNVVIEPCSKTKRANMTTTDGSSAPCFYFYLLVIHELGVLIPFTSFEEDFLATINVPPS